MKPTGNVLYYAAQMLRMRMRIKWETKMKLKDMKFSNSGDDTASIWRGRNIRISKNETARESGLKTFGRYVIEMNCISNMRWKFGMISLWKLIHYKSDFFIAVRSIWLYFIWLYELCTSTALWVPYVRYQWSDNTDTVNRQFEFYLRSR